MKSKTNVNYTNVEYEVDETNKTVKCYLDYDIQLYKYPLNDLNLDINILISILKKFDINSIRYNDDGRPYLEMTSMGSAKCHVHDEYNEEIGKRIALTRSQAKAFETTCKIYDAICERMDKIVNETIRYIDNNYKSATKCWNHVLKIDDCGIKNIEA